MRDSQGGSVEAASWVTAYWPDDSVKWTAHAIGTSSGGAEGYVVQPVVGSDSAAAQSGGVKVAESSESVRVDTGSLTAVFPSEIESLPMWLMFVD